MFLLLLVIPLVSAVPPVTQTQQFTTGLIIESTPQTYLTQNENFTFNYFVYNISNGAIIDDTYTTCMFFMADAQGNLIYSSNSTYSEYWFNYLNGSVLSETGYYPYGYSCQDDNINVGGAGVGMFEVSKTGYEHKNEPIAFIILLIGTIIVLLFVMSQLSKEHFLFKLLLFFFVFIILQLLGNYGTTIVEAGNTSALIFFNIALWLWRLFVTYVLVYFIYSLFKMKQWGFKRK